MDSAPKDRTYYFCNSRDGGIGQPINERTLLIDLQALAKELEIPTGRAEEGLVTHSLRHFFETQCVNSGVPQFVVDSWMGHAGEGSMGQRYYALTDDKNKKFVNSVQF